MAGIGKRKAMNVNTRGYRVAISREQVDTRKEQGNSRDKEGFIREEQRATREEQGDTREEQGDIREDHEATRCPSSLLCLRHFSIC